MQQADLAAEDEAAIRDLLRDMADAWARGSGADYAAVFTDDARYVTASGTRGVGRRAIARSHQHVFDSVFRGTRLDVDEPVEFQPVAPTVVLVHGSGQVVFPGADAHDPARSKGLLTARPARPRAGNPPAGHPARCLRRATKTARRSPGRSLPPAPRVRPQTIRYRMHRPRDLFGERLDNPDDRLAMESVTAPLGDHNGQAAEL